MVVLSITELSDPSAHLDEEETGGRRDSLLRLSCSQIGLDFEIREARNL